MAVATFGNERWLPQLYVGAEDVVLKPMYENLLSRDPKTGELSPLLAERWEVLDGGAWRFHLRRGPLPRGPGGDDRGGCRPPSPPLPGKGPPIAWRRVSPDQEHGSGRPVHSHPAF